jgi:hypothetical protein
MVEYNWVEWGEGSRIWRSDCAREKTVVIYETEEGGRHEAVIMVSPTQVHLALWRSQATMLAIIEGIAWHWTEGQEPRRVKHSDVGQERKACECARICVSSASNSGHQESWFCVMGHQEAILA